MSQRNAIIPGIDAEVEVHGEMPVLAEQLEAYGIKAFDLRDDREKFADLANPLIDSYPARLSAPWYQFNSVACSVPDAVVRNRLIFHAGLPVVGVGNLRWEATAAEVARKGELQVPDPDVHFKGRTGLLVGRSSFNYYHFISDVLIFLEDLYDLVEELGLDRIVINPCRDNPNGFQRQMINALYPELSERIVLDETVFSAEHLTFVDIWPSYFSPGEGDEAIKRSGPKGTSRRAFRSSARPFYDRAARTLSDANSGPDVLIISRRGADRRQIVNDDALLDALKGHGAEAIIMEQLSVREQMALCANAKVVIGAHGAGMINSGFCRAGATCIELTGRHYLQRGSDFASLAMIRNLEYQFVIADEEGDIEKMHGNTGNDIRLATRAIDHIVETVDNALGR
ncbi:MAG: DUF563 domain-containing protein [Paracoccaceae bacterium]